jgi:glyoxylase-like metal-dependent hydrolase (beta-lactamase superfamily II)
MIFRQMFEQNSSTYTYLLADENSSEALLIDPVLEHLQQYLELLRDLNLTLKFALDTHLHADHITALGALREATGCTTMMGVESQAPCVSCNFVHDDRIAIGAVELQVLHTPGHTDDSYCFLLRGEQQPWLFSGDTLLIRGTGRTDFQNGDAAVQYQSLQRLLRELPENTLVYPGHDYKGWTVTTLGEERRCNPRLQVSSQDEYVRLMDNLHLPHPAQMDVAVPANRQCGAGL